MPQKDTSHEVVKQALMNSGWEITDDPYVINYERTFLYVDLAATSAPHTASSIEHVVIGAQRDDTAIAVEIKEFRGLSLIADLQQAIGQYVMYRLLLKRTDPDRQLYLAITDTTYERLLNQAVALIMIDDVPLWLIVVDTERLEVKKWIQSHVTGRF